MKESKWRTRRQLGFSRDKRRLNKVEEKEMERGRGEGQKHGEKELDQRKGRWIQLEEKMTEVYREKGDDLSRRKEDGEGDRVEEKEMDLKRAHPV